MSYAEAALAGVEAAFGVAATYTPNVPGSEPVAITLVPSLGNDPAGLGNGRVSHSAGLFEVRRSAWPDPQPDTLIIVTGTGERWRLSGKPESRDGDHDRLVWILRCRPDAELHRRSG